MTDDEWLDAANLTWLLKALRTTVADRKLRLFGVGCCRRVWYLLADEHSRQAVEIAERYADGLVSHIELVAAHQQAVLVALTMQAEAERPSSASPTLMAQATAANAASLVAVSTFSLSAVEVSWQVTAAEWCGVEPEDGGVLRESQGSLLGHIVGGPFRQRRPMPPVPLTVRELAEAVYQQDQAAIGPLHDALLDAGLTDLAEHFNDPAESHPKGCWAVDLLTARG